MTTGPSGFKVGPQFPARLALVLPDALDRIRWEDEHAEVVGADLVENWSDLIEVPGEDRWRRAAFPARPPFRSPGWTVYEARLDDDGFVELRRIEYIAVESSEPD